MPPAAVFVSRRSAKVPPRSIQFQPPLTITYITPPAPSVFPFLPFLHLPYKELSRFTYFTRHTRGRSSQLHALPSPALPYRPAYKLSPSRFFLGLLARSLEEPYIITSNLLLPPLRSRRTTVFMFEQRRQSSLRRSSYHLPKNGVPRPDTRPATQFHPPRFTFAPGWLPAP